MTDRRTFNLVTMPPLSEMTVEQIADALVDIDEMRDEVDAGNVAAFAIVWVGNGDVSVSLAAPQNDWSRLLGGLDLAQARIRDFCGLLDE